MGDEFAHAVPRVSVGRFDGAACFQMLQGQRAGPVIFLGDFLECLDDFRVLALCEEVFGGFFQPDHRYSCNAQEEDECSV